MKKFKKLVLLFLAATVTLVSCNKDDDKEASIEGSWEYSQETNFTGELVAYQHTADCNKDYVQILAGGVIKDFYYETFGSVVCEESIYEAAWARSGNNLTITDSGETYTSEILELTDTTLKLKYTDPDDDSVDITVFTRR
ncbi:lipocalin family protein [Flavobacterium gelidilacus]|uniref:lipocalin family protein n=1 Tax=Flavobacterium gelidilacus TaxID=206041 RepID=UPI0003FF44C7|nr:lipocalin family protein [Flavobacterium gelidilacus]